MNNYLRPGEYIGKSCSKSLSLFEITRFKSFDSSRGNCNSSTCAGRRKYCAILSIVASFKLYRGHVTYTRNRIGRSPTIRMRNRCCTSALSGLGKYSQSFWMCKRTFVRPSMASHGWSSYVLMSTKSSRWASTRYDTYAPSKSIHNKFAARSVLLITRI